MPVRHRVHTHSSLKSLINPICSGVLCLFPVFKFRDSRVLLHFSAAQISARRRSRRTQTLRFEHFVCSSSSTVRSFTLKFHLVLKAFLYVRFDCFSVFARRLRRLLRVFFAASFVMTLTTSLSSLARTHIVICSAMSLRYKIPAVPFSVLRLRMGSPLSACCDTAPIPPPSRRTK